MNYRLEDLEDQIIEALRTVPAFSKTAIETHAGGITGMYFTEPSLKEGLVTRLPFIFIQYQGKKRVDEDSSGTMDEHLITFRLFVGAQSIRRTKESQRSIYATLRLIYETLHGKFFDYDGMCYSNKLQNVTQIQTTMSQQRPLREADGTIEQLIVNLPDIVVYYVDYTCSLTSS